MSFSPDLNAGAADSATQGWAECMSTLTEVSEQLKATEKALSRANAVLKKLGYVPEHVPPPSKKKRKGPPNRPPPAPKKNKKSKRSKRSKRRRKSKRPKSRRRSRRTR